MGSYAGLKIQNQEKLSMKSFVYGNIACLFSEQDKTINTRVEVEEDESEEQWEYEEVKYTTTAKKSLERLEVMGFTPKRSIEEVIQLLHAESVEEDDVSYMTERAKRLLALNPKVLFKLISKVTIFQGEYYLNKSRKLKCYDRLKDVHDFIHEALEDQLIDIRYILAIMLSNASPETRVELDVSDLVSGGYYQSEDTITADAQNELLKDVSKDERVLILTEGSTDAWIIKAAFSVLMPHLEDKFAFLDHSKMNPKGGANALAEFIKAFASSGIRNKIIGIFDNDTAAKDAHRILDVITLPDAITTIFLPTIKVAKSYPTIGPQGDNIAMDVNSLAVSIEMFVCEDLLKEDGQFIPVQWKGLISSQGTYQGEVGSKQLIFKRFKKRIKDIRGGKVNIEDFDWSALQILLDKIRKTAAELGSV